MRNLTLLPALLGILALSACASRTPYYDSQYGHAVNTAKALQTLNPQASRNTDPVVGLDGPSAAQSIDRYHDSFKAPEQTFEVISGAR